MAGNRRPVPLRGRHRKSKSRYGGCATGGYYGDFDEFGFWTLWPNELYEDELDDGTLVKRYSDDDGAILGSGGSDPKKAYPLLHFIDEGGAWACYLISRKTNLMDENTKICPIAGSVISMWTGGHILTDIDMKKIDGKFYRFDENGYPALITNDFVEDDVEGKIYGGVDGAQVKGAFVPYNDRLIYIGADGKQVFKAWIEDE